MHSSNTDVYKKCSKCNQLLVKNPENFKYRSSENSYSNICRNCMLVIGENFSGSDVYGVIYKITNLVNKKVYIGQSIWGFDGRYGSVERLGKNTHNAHLKKSIAKYGIENFEVDKCFDFAYSAEELDELEQYYIKMYNSTDEKYGYNKESGGTGGKGIPSEQTRRLMSVATKKWMHTEEGKKILSLNNGQNKKIKCLTDGNVFRSIRECADFYDIHVDSIINFIKGKRQTCHGYEFAFCDDDEPINEEKIRMEVEKPKFSIKGVRCLNDGKEFKTVKECREYYGISSTGIWNVLSGKWESTKGLSFQVLEGTNFKKTHSEEAKKKIGEKSKGSNNGNSKKVICLNDMKIYDTVRACCDTYNIPYKQFSSILKGKRKLTNDLKFMYYDDYVNSDPFKKG